MAKSSARGNAELIALTKELVDRLDEFYGLYLDSIAGFQRNAELIERGQRNSIVQLRLTSREVDSRPIFIGRGDPNDRDNVIQNRTTQGEYKARNAPGGKNYQLLSQYFIVVAFSLWEHEYRERIASLLGHDEKDELKLPMFGDIRLLRNDILHHGGVVSRRTANQQLEIMTGQVVGKEVWLSEGEMEKLVRGIKSSLDELVLTATGSDPQFRTIWHVQ